MPDQHDDELPGYRFAGRLAAPEECRPDHPQAVAMAAALAKEFAHLTLDQAAVELNAWRAIFARKLGEGRDDLPPELREDLAAAIAGNALGMIERVHAELGRPAPARH